LISTHHKKSKGILTKTNNEIIDNIKPIRYSCHSIINKYFRNTKSDPSPNIQTNLDDINIIVDPKKFMNNIKNLLELSIIKGLLTYPSL